MTLVRSFLPQADAEVVPPASFESLFGTPHGLDVTALASAYGVPASVVEDAAGLRRTIDEAFAAGGGHVVVVRTDRSANVVVHRRLNAARSEEHTSELQSLMPLPYA